jgi:hypothetical protein
MNLIARFLVQQSIFNDEEKKIQCHNPHGHGHGHGHGVFILATHPGRK